METKLIHPYWDIYCKLAALQNCSLNSGVKDSVRRLAKEARLNTLDQMSIEILTLLPWFRTIMINETFLRYLRERFAYTALSPATLEILASCSPLVELGAGNGYNAWLLQQLGSEVIAIDAFPVEEGKNWFFHTNWLGMPTHTGTSFTKVLKGDADSLDNYSDFTLLLCWPPKNKMASVALSHYHGKKLVLIGEKKCCANSAFYKKLKHDWQLQYATKTGVWESLYTEWLEIYVRSASSQ